MVDLLGKYKEESSPAAEKRFSFSSDAFGDEGEGKMAGWVMRFSGGMVKDGKQANMVLAGLAFLILLISLYMVFGSGSSATQQNVAPSPTNRNF